MNSEELSKTTRYQPPRSRSFPEPGCAFTWRLLWRLPDRETSGEMEGAMSGGGEGRKDKHKECNKYNRRSRTQSHV